LGRLKGLFYVIPVEIEVLVAEILPECETMHNTPGNFDRVLENGALLQCLE